MMSLIALVGATWAYWDILKVTENEVITIGHGRAVVVEAEPVVPAGKTLVPAGVAMGVNDINEIKLTYKVKTNNEDLDLSVRIANKKINGSTDYTRLVNIVVDHPNIVINNDDQLITVTITLTEPADQIEYNAIVKGSITFDIVFTGTIA